MYCCLLVFTGTCALRAKFKPAMTKLRIRVRPYKRKIRESCEQINVFASYSTLLNFNANFASVCDGQTPRICVIRVVVSMPNLSLCATYLVLIIISSDVVY